MSYFISFLNSIEKLIWKLKNVKMSRYNTLSKPENIKKRFYGAEIIKQISSGSDYIYTFEVPYFVCVPTLSLIKNDEKCDKSDIATKACERSDLNV